MSLTFSEFDSYKFTTEFSGGGYTHTIPYTLESGSTGVTIEKWDRLERVGSGSFGTVWKEKCAQNGRVRAIKQIRLSHVKDKGEMLALTKLNSYPQHFVQFLGWFQDEEHIYLAMEFLECGDLQKHITEVGLSEKEVKTITTQLLGGLGVMHRNNFCHRDLKPQNILIARWFPIMVKIADFGIAKHVGDKTVLRTFAGTFDYVAPEILGFLDSNTSEYTNSVDIWSLGCLIYTMITKETPFPGAKGLLNYVQGRTTLPRAKLGNSTATEFIISLMMPRPKDRLTAEQAQNHPWLRLEQADEETFWEEHSSAANPKLKQSPPTSMITAKPRSKNINTSNMKKGQALITAAMNGLVDIVKLMLDQGAGITIKDKSGYTALHRAAGNGHREVVQLLLEKGADINERNEEWTALHWAVWNDHIEVVKLMLEAGADITAQTIKKETPLILAAVKGNKEMVKLLLEKGADINERNDEEWTALHWAVWNNHIELVKLVLEAGADINERNEEWTALHWAVWNDHIELVKLVLEAGADITAQTIKKETPLILAAVKGNKEMVKLLLEKGADINERNDEEWTALHWAVWNNHIELVKLVLEAGADITAQTIKKETPLILAAVKGNKEMVKLLLEKGADINERNEEWTGLHWAVWNDHIEVVKLMLEAGADITAQTIKKETPLILAAVKGNKEMVKLLLEKGADINERNDEEWTALHWAVWNNHIELVKLVLEAGADITAQTIKKTTPLTLAAEKGNKEMVKLLLEKGADINERGSWEWTALHWAASNGHTGVMQLLLDAGADDMAIDINEETPIQKAAANSHKEAVLLLIDFETEAITENTHQSASLSPTIDGRPGGVIEPVSLPEALWNGDTLVETIDTPVVGNGGSVVNEDEGPIASGEARPIVRQEEVLVIREEEPRAGGGIEEKLAEP